MGYKMAIDLDIDGEIGKHLENNNPDTFFIAKIGGFDYGEII